MSSHFPLLATNKKRSVRLRLFLPIVMSFALFLAGCAGKRPEPAPEIPPVVIFAGDSIMEGLGPELERSLRLCLGKQDNGSGLKYSADAPKKRCESASRAGKAISDIQGPVFVQAGVSSSGLCRPDFHDWPARMRELVAKARSGWVIICIGTNDDQSVTGADGKKRVFGTAAWAKAYAHRVGELIRIIERSGARQIWLSPPVMREPLGGRVHKIKGVIAQACAEHHVPYLDIWQNLADVNGGFQRYLVQTDGTKIAIRTKDGVHLTRAGNQVLAKQLEPFLTSTMQLK